RKSPETRAAWGAARSAAASLGAQRGAYYPTFYAQEATNRTKGSAAGGEVPLQTTPTKPYPRLNYPLPHFRRRRGARVSAPQALIAANWTHNGSIQDAVLRVEQATYQYLNARALAKAEEAAVKEARASLDAATRRHDAGVATIADVLQAKTALSQAQLQLETV